MLADNTLKYNFKNKKFVIFDFETSCLNLAINYNKIWQASWIVCDGYKVIEEFDYYLKWPDFYISPGAAQATRFNPATIEAKGVDPKGVLDHFNSYLYDPQYTICGFNILGFDVYLHNMFRKSYGQLTDYSYINRIIDVRSLAVAWKLNTKFKPEEDFLAQQYRFLDYRQRGFKTNLTQMCRDLDIPVDENKMHDGATDIIQTFEVFKKLVNLLEI